MIVEFPHHFHDGVGGGVVGKGFTHLLKEGTGVGGAEAGVAVVLEGDGDAGLGDGELRGWREVEIVVRAIYEV